MRNLPNITKGTENKLRTSTAGLPAYFTRYGGLSDRHTHQWQLVVYIGVVESADPDVGIEAIVEQVYEVIEDTFDILPRDVLSIRDTVGKTGNFSHTCRFHGSL